MKYKIPAHNTIGISFSQHIGDNIIGLVLANNFAINGYNTTFLANDAISQLAAWSPNFNLALHPSGYDYSEAICKQFDTIISIPQGSHIYYYDGSGADRIIKISTSSMNRKIPYIENIKNIACNIFGLTQLTTDHGLQPPTTLTKRKFNNRVIIHPLSRQSIKNWPIEKYNNLALLLINLGYQPVFIMSQEEKLHHAKFIDKNIPIPEFNNFIEVAEFIYESGYMIGNDSGIGHLASCLGVPTLIIFRKKNRLTFWRPYWSINKTITPPIGLTYLLSKNLWKKTLSEKAVTHAFLKLLEETHDQV